MKTEKSGQKFKVIETKGKYILDIIDEGIKEVYLRFDVEEKKKEAQQLKSSEMIKRRGRQVAQNLLYFYAKTLTGPKFSQRFVF